MPKIPQWKPYSEGVVLSTERIAILDALLEIPTAKLRDVSKKTGLNSSTVLKAFTRDKTLIWAGLVEKTDYGSYKIVPSKREGIEDLVKAWHKLFPKADKAAVLK